MPTPNRPIVGSRTRLGRVRALVRLLHAVRYRRPGTPPIGLRRMTMHFLRCTAQLDTFRDWFGNPNNPALQQALAQRPSLATRILHPYLHVDWSMARKVAVISAHYKMLDGRLGFLRFAQSGSITLADLGEGLQFRLDKPGKFEHEGELTLNLFSGALRIYSLAFTLGQIGGRRMAYVGALQGLGSPEALETIRSLTHHLHGWRPRDALLTALRFLCVALEVERILAISDRKRVSAHPYFASSVFVLSSYDSAWADSGGVEGDDGFFELRPVVVLRANVDIPSRKRAQYRRRYAMLEALSQQIETTVRQRSGGA